jgi:hypothetical protein
VSISLGDSLLYSVDAPPETNVRQIDELLTQGVRDGIWIYQDGAVRRDRKQAGEDEGVGAQQ